MDLFHGLEPAVDALGGKNARHKGQHRDQVPQALVPRTVKQICAEQHDVAGLAIGKYLVPAKVSIGVLEAAGQNDKGSSQHGFGHLTAQLVERRHFCTSLSKNRPRSAAGRQP